MEGGWTIALDGRELKTPARRALVLPTGELAQAIAREWRQQAERIDLAAMHLTRLANVAIDRAPETRAELAEEAARYAETDLVCHLAETPAILRQRQEAAWAPLRAWASEALGVRLIPVEGVIAITQPAVSI